MTTVVGGKRLYGIKVHYPKSDEASEGRIVTVSLLKSQSIGGNRDEVGNEVYLKVN